MTGPSKLNRFKSVCTLGLCRKRSGSLTASSGASSEIGNVRSTNDDLVFASNDCRLYVALDGVGGHAGGGQASRIVLEKLRAGIESMCEQVSGKPDQHLKEAVSHALNSASEAMLNVAAANPALERMGTVFALAYVVDTTLLYTHVGDSRIYLVRCGKARQLTSDETYLQLMLDVGVITPSDAKDHPMRNVILNSVGARSPESRPSVQSTMLLPGDTVLLTTDGVTDYLGIEALEGILAEHSDPQLAAEAIVGAALESQSRDNASCVVVRFDRAEQVSSEAESELHDELHSELTKLHEMLSDVQEADEGLKAHLMQIATDVQNALHRGASKELVPLRKRLEEQALAFEVSHPHLTNVVGSITNLLAAIGI